MDVLKLFSFAPHEVQLDNGNLVYVRRITAADRVEWLDHISKNVSETEENFALSLSNAAKLLSIALCTKEGTRIFKNEEDAKHIDAQLLDSLSKTAMYINGMSTEGHEDAKKNSPPTQTTTTS